MSQGMKIQLDIQGHISNLRDITNSLQKALENGVDKSSGSYQKLARDLKGVIDQITTLSNKNPDGLFSSTNKLQQFEKDYEKIGLALKNIASGFEDLEIKDLKLNDLDPQVINLKNLKKSADDAHQALQNLDSLKLKDFLQSDATGFLEQLQNLKIDVDSATFENVIEALKRQADSLDESLKKVGKTVLNINNDLANNLEKQNRINDALKANKLRQKEIKKDLDYQGRNTFESKTYKNNNLRWLENTARDAGFSDKAISKAFAGVKNGEVDSETTKKRIERFYNEVISSIQQEQKTLEAKKKELENTLNEVKNNINKIQQDQNEAKKEYSKVQTERDVNRARTRQAETESKNSSRNERIQSEAEEQARKTANAYAEAEEAVKRNAEATRAAENVNKEYASSYGELQSKIEPAQVELERLNQKLGNLQYIQNSIGRWFGFYQILNLTRRSVKEMISTIRELDSAMTEIAVVTDMTQKDLWGQMKIYSDLANTYGTSIKGVYEISALFYQQGARKDS